MHVSRSPSQLARSQSCLNTNKADNKKTFGAVKDNLVLEICRIVFAHIIYLQCLLVSLLQNCLFSSPKISIEKTSLTWLEKTITIRKVFLCHCRDVQTFIWSYSLRFRQEYKLYCVLKLRQHIRYQRSNKEN